MRFQRVAPVQGLLAGAAVPALAFRPAVFLSFEPDVPLVAGKAFRDGMLAIGMLRAIHAAPRQQAGEVRDADAEHLPGQDVIDALLQIRHFDCQPVCEAARDLAQENTRLGAGIQELHGLVRPQVRAGVVGRPGSSQRVQHSVGELWRREDLVVRQVRDAGQHVRVATPQREGGLLDHRCAPRTNLARSVRSIW